MPRRRAILAVPILVALGLAPTAGCGDPGDATPRPGVEVGLEHDLPFWVWRALPQAFPQYVPGAGGYLAFGFEWKLGEQLPVGLEKTEHAIPRIRSTEPGAPGVPPGPVGVGGTSPDIEGYRDFLIAAARDPRFTAENLMPFIQYNTRLSWLRRVQYRQVVIPQAREALLRLEER